MDQKVRDTRVGGCPHQVWSAMQSSGAIVAGLLLFVFVVIHSASAAAPKPSEYDVKAAYLFNFGKFVKWPASNDARNFTICVLGQDHFGEALDRTVSGEKINSLPVVVRRIASVDEAAGCRVVFIDASEERRLATVLPILSRAGVLTVSDMPTFLDRGGMIQFQLVGDRVRFEVNLDAAERAGLALSSDLLKVATKVRRGGAS
jgi:hypothetical protein